MNRAAIRRWACAGLGLFFSGAALAQPASGGVISFALASSIPTLSEWGMLALVATLGLLAWHAFRRQGQSGRFYSLLAAAVGVTLVLGSVFGARNAYSNGSIDAANYIGSSYNFPPDIDEVVYNSGDRDVIIVSIQAASSGYTIVPPNTLPQCQVGMRIPAHSAIPFCYVRVESNQL